VLVSSHLMSEMEDTADHLVVLGRGRLLADVPMEELLGAHSAVRVRTPQGPMLADALRRAGGRVELEIDGALRVEGLGLTEVGDVAFLADVRLHELSRVTASLEAAYLALTDSDVEYRAVTR
jgi:ABC-2 type transport system ATP-binding protein